MLLEGKKDERLQNYFQGWNLAVLMSDKEYYYIHLEIRATEDLFNLFVHVTQTHTYASVSNVCSVKYLLLCIGNFSGNIFSQQRIYLSYEKLRSKRQKLVLFCFCCCYFIQVSSLLEHIILILYNRQKKRQREVNKAKRTYTKEVNSANLDKCNSTSK